MPGPVAVDPPAARLRVTWVEWVLLGVICLIGAGLRFAFAERMAIEHFDEGVYASNWFCRPPGLPELTFPQQHLYAPPLFPELLRWVLFFSRGDPESPLWVSVAAGCLMIPLMWWIGRDWTGPAAGLAAAGLCAVSTTHIAFSRMALTDVLMTLFLTAGVWSGCRAVLSGRPGWIVLAGLLAALAWWTKYNGWLTLAITGAGLAGWLVLERPVAVAAGTLIGRWLMIAAVAVGLWSPVLWDLQSTGGYSVVSQNHAKYFVGPGGWWDALREQLARQQAFDSWLGGLAVVGVLLTAVWFGNRRMGAPGDSRTRGCCGVGLLCPLMVWGGMTAGLGAAALGLWVLSIVRGLGAESSERDPSQRSTLPLWMGLAWILGLAVAIPLYTPYPRLVVPALPVIWLGVAQLAAPASEREWAYCGGRGRAGLFVLAMVGLSVAGVLAGAGPERLLSRSPWQDRRGMLTAAHEIVSAASADFEAAPAEGRQGLQAVFYTFAEPPLFYHLSALQRDGGWRYWVQPVGDHGLLDAGPPDGSLATYLVTGPHAAAMAEDAQRIEAAVASGRLREVRQLVCEQSDLVQLDEGPLRSDPREPCRVRVFRVRAE